VHIVLKKEENSLLFDEFFNRIGAFYCCYKVCLNYAKVSLHSMVSSQNFGFDFWVGFVAVLILVFGCFVAFKHIKKYISEVEKL